ncbi:MAG: ROK family protein [Chloroflexi bacterium]|nr:ROK family protein [Chloroflexota bacterium]
MVEPIVVGVDLGGTKIAAASATLTGQILHRVRHRTDAQAGPERIIAQIVEAVDAVTLRQHLPLQGVTMIGVGAPGPTSCSRGIVYTAPNLAGWRDVPLRALIERATGLPVQVENDANAATVAEHRWGAGRGVRDLVYLTVSTGIGGGLIFGGRLYRGAAETAGEVGHITIDYDGPLCHCGSRGCLETFASGTAITRRARERIRAGEASVIESLANGESERISAELVHQAAVGNDALACDLMREAGTYLGIGIASLTNLLSPARVIVGGGVAQAGELLLAPARAEVQRRAFRPAVAALEIVPAQLGVQAGLLGAIAVALDGLASGGQVAA